MRLHFELLVGLLLLLAGRHQALVNKVDDSKVGVFHFDGSNNGFAELDPGEDQWGNEESSYYSSSRIISLGTWIKPEKNATGMNTIMQFKLSDHYKLSINEDRLKLLVVKQSGSYKVYDFPNFDVSSNTWHFVLLAVTASYTRGLSPSLHVKGLDKAPLKLLTSEISEEGDVEEVSTKTKTLIIGQGFSGRIAPPLMRRHSSSSYFNRYRECLTNHDQASSKCRTSSYSTTIIPRSALVSSYNMSQNSSIKIEPYSEISVSFNTELQCKDFEVSLSILPAAFNLPSPTMKSVGYYQRDSYYGNRYRTRTYLYYPVNVTLGKLESGCNLTWIPTEGGFQISNTNLTTCGFESQNEGGEVMYQNSVFSHTHTESRKLMDVSCRYVPRPVVRDEVRVSAYVVDEINLETTHSFTPWTLSLHLFSDPSFSEELDVPVKLGSTGEMIYVEARLGARVGGLKLGVQSCRTHITLNELDEMQRTLIKNYEVASSSVEFLTYDNSTRRRFKFKADKFEEYPKAMVYLSCVLTAGQTEHLLPGTAKTRQPTEETTAQKFTKKQTTKAPIEATTAQKFTKKQTTKSTSTYYTSSTSK